MASKEILEIEGSGWTGHGEVKMRWMRVASGEGVAKLAVIYLWIWSETGKNDGKLDVLKVWIWLNATAIILISNPLCSLITIATCLAFLSSSQPPDDCSSSMSIIEDQTQLSLISSPHIANVFVANPLPLCLGKVGGLCTLAVRALYLDDAHCLQTGLLCLHVALVSDMPIFPEPQGMMNLYKISISMLARWESTHWSRRKSQSSTWKFILVHKAGDIDCIVGIDEVLSKGVSDKWATVTPTFLQL